MPYFGPFSDLTLLAVALFKSEKVRIRRKGERVRQPRFSSNDNTEIKTDFQFTQTYLFSTSIVSDIAAKASSQGHELDSSTAD